jgi:hypothetical protein
MATLIRQRLQCNAAQLPDLELEDGYAAILQELYAVWGAVIPTYNSLSTQDQIWMERAVAFLTSYMFRMYKPKSNANKDVQRWKIQQTEYQFAKLVPTPAMKSIEDALLDEANSALQNVVAIDAYYAARAKDVRAFRLLGPTRTALASTTTYKIDNFSDTLLTAVGRLLQ